MWTGNDHGYQQRQQRQEEFSMYQEESWSYETEQQQQQQQHYNHGQMQLMSPNYYPPSRPNKHQMISNGDYFNNMKHHNQHQHQHQQQKQDHMFHDQNGWLHGYNNAMHGHNQLGHAGSGGHIGKQKPGHFQAMNSMFQNHGSFGRVHSPPHGHGMRVDHEMKYDYEETSNWSAHDETFEHNNFNWRKNASRSF